MTVLPVNGDVKLKGNHPEDTPVALLKNLELVDDDSGRYHGITIKPPTDGCCR